MNRLMAVALSGLLVLGACGGGGGDGDRTNVAQPTPEPGDQTPTDPTTDPAYHLGTARFTTHQPDVLEQIGAHHAYARGLTGRGVKIGIEDSIVDYTQTAEFGNRVKLSDADGAILSYSRPFGDVAGSDIDVCRRTQTCTIWEGNSQGDLEVYNDWVRDIVSQDGWPTRDDSVFFVDEYYAENSGLGLLYRWREVPTPYGVGSHGTIVASVAAGEDLGVAPEVTIIPITKNLTDDQNTDNFASGVLREAITLFSLADRRVFDSELADYWRENYLNFDIINRSFGTQRSRGTRFAPRTRRPSHKQRSHTPAFMPTPRSGSKTIG